MKYIYPIIIILLLFTASPVQYSIEQIKRYTGYSEQYKRLTWPIYEAVMVAELESGISVDLILAIIHSESNFTPRAVSSAGARGLMQVMVFWDKNPERLFQPFYNVRTGSQIFKNYLSMSGGDILTALKYYNAGPKGKTWNGPYITAIIKNLAKSQPSMTIAQLTGM